MHDDFDRSSKWLLQHYGSAFLRLAGIQRKVRSWRSLQADVIQPRQLPDGLLEVEFEDDITGLFLLEIATYPEPRVERQMLRDTLLVLLDRRILPEVITLVLHPRGNAQVAHSHRVLSDLGQSRLEISWTVVELWKLSAEELLQSNELGVIPWVPLSHFEGAPDGILHECRQRIEQQTDEETRANMPAVAQVLARLRYNDPQLLAIFGGRQIMIESPLIKELKAEFRQSDIATVLEARFETIPTELKAALQAVTEDAALDDLIKWAARCPDLAAFRERLQEHHADK